MNPLSCSSAFRAFLAAPLLILALLAAGCGRKAAAPAGSSTASSTPAATTATAGNATSAAPADGKTAASTPSGGPAAKAGASNAAAKKAADAEKEKARMAAAEQIPVEVAPVARGPISASLNFNTTLETEAAVDIYPQTSGQVEALLVEEGRLVKEGDPLLKIEDRELRVDLEQGEANYEHSQLNAKRIADLYARNLVHKQEYDDSQYQLNQSRLQYERAKLRLSYATVRAPFGGVITARETQVGARVSTGTKLFSMVKLDEIVARVFVPGRYLASVTEAQPAVVTSDFLPDRTFNGWVKRVSPVIDPKSGTFKVTVGVRPEPAMASKADGEAPKPADSTAAKTLPPGLFVSVRIITDTRPTALLVPKRALVYEGGERYVYVMNKDRVTKKKLSIGYEDPLNVEAVSGVDADAQVVVLGQSGLKDGAVVRAVNLPPPAKADATEAPKAAATAKAESTTPAGASAKTAE